MKKNFREGCGFYKNLYKGVGLIAVTLVVLTIPAAAQIVTAPNEEGNATEKTTYFVNEDVHNVAEPTEGFLVGDVNHDGFVKSEDARAILRHVADIPEREGEIFDITLADLDKDHEVRAKDARYLIRIAAGLQDADERGYAIIEEPEEPKEPVKIPAYKTLARDYKGNPVSDVDAPIVTVITCPVCGRRPDPLDGTNYVDTCKDLIFVPEEQGFLNIEGVVARGYSTEEKLFALGFEHCEDERNNNPTVAPGTVIGVDTNGNPVREGEYEEEKPGCYYCGKTDCPSLIFCNEYNSWRNYYVVLSIGACTTEQLAEWGVTECPEYDEHKDASKYCQVCGMPKGKGPYACTTYVNDIHCINCGEDVKAYECHHCKLNTEDGQEWINQILNCAPWIYYPEQSEWKNPEDYPEFSDWW